jgi:hypothetical protein
MARCAIASPCFGFCSTSNIAVPYIVLISRMLAITRSTSSGASPMDGSSRISSRGPDISAMPMASICCCPPLSAPPICCWRSANTGNNANTCCIRFISSVRSVTEKPPSSRFCRTLNVRKMPWPCGTNAKPSAMLCEGLRPVMSRSSNVTVQDRARISPKIVPNSVVFPAPLWPSTAVTMDLQTVWLAVIVREQMPSAIRCNAEDAPVSQIHAVQIALTIEGRPSRNECIGPLPRARVYALSLSPTRYSSGKRVKISVCTVGGSANTGGPLRACHRH